MEKVIKSGLVAVLISPDFGAGWSTWNSEIPEIIFRIHEYDGSETLELKDVLPWITA
jgi:hypothetical protein